MSIGNKNKSDLNLYCQKSHILIATYTSAMQDGLFESRVCVNGTEYSSTSGYSTKKEAENDAAGVALIAILQKEFGGKSIEEALAILEQRHPSKNKKKSKQALITSSVGVAQSETQVYRDAERSRVQRDANSVTSGQIGGSTAQHGGVAQTQMLPQQQKPLVESSMVQNLSQIHSGSPQSVTVRPTQTQSGAIIGQYQVTHSHHQTVVRPHVPGALQQSEIMGQAPQQQHQQAMVGSNRAYVGSNSQQAVTQGQDNPNVVWSQGAMTTPKGGGGVHEQVQRTPDQPSASSANIHPTSYPTGSRGQAPPTQGYAPLTGPYYYQVQGYPPANSAAYGQNYAPPYMQPSYMYQAPPTGGNQWPHPQPHPPHPRLINSNPPGAYPPPPSGPQIMMPTGAQMRVAPPSGARLMAARFPGTAPPSTQQSPPVLPSSRPPPPPGFSANQSAASPPQTAPNKPLNAIPVTQLSGQGLPCGTAGNVKQDVESASQKDSAKSLDFGHTKKLEELCKTRNLPPPQYKINQDKGKYFAEVRIGGQTFHTQWPCEYFEQAKSTAAMEAMTNLAMSMSTLSTSDTGIGWGVHVHCTYTYMYHMA